MKLKTASVLKLSALALAIAAPLMASAESQLVTGSGDASADLKFEVKIPRVLFLGVGAGAALPLATNTTVDTLTFDYTNAAAAVGNGTASTEQGVDVMVRGNAGQIQIAATGTAGGLSNGVGDSISWDEISATSDNSTDFDVPAVGGSTEPSLNGSSSKVTHQSTRWNFQYLNTDVVAPGTYTGTITYTATNI